MAIQIPSNLMNRPNLPGGLSDGTENMTRQFGNMVEQAGRLPGVPQGLGGVANPAAGIEGEAMSRAAESIARSAQDVNQYFDGLRTAEEDSKAKLMFLEIEKREAEVRSRLAADPEYAKLTTTEQQQRYEVERDVDIDQIRSSYGFKQKAVVRAVDENLAQFKGRASLQYLEKEVKPRVVAQQAINDGKSDDLVLNKVAIEPTVANVAAAAQNILERYDSPQAYAAYGAQKAAQMKGAAIGRLAQTATAGFQETIEKESITKSTTGEVDTENFTNGPVRQAINDQKARMALLVSQLPIPEGEKLVLQAQGDKYIEGMAKKSVLDHNKIVKDAEAKRLESIKDTVDIWQVNMSMQARNGGVTNKQLFAQYTKMLQHPDFKDDPQAQKRLYMAFDAIDKERVGYEREQRRLASDRRTRETIAESRVENGIGISGSAADSMWKKNGTLKSFFEGGNVVSPGLVQDMDRMGAVPTSVLNSIQTDLRSGDPRVVQRGVKNLQAIKGFSSKTQNALYRDLPDDFAGVIHRLEMGQTPQEALSFLTRQRGTPDEEKKLRNDAGKKEGLSTANKVLKESNLDPENMSPMLRDRFYDQWREAYAKAQGDSQLASKLFQQNVSKNRTVGVSDFSGKVEQYPATRFADKEVVTEIINRDLPETKDKDILPVYNGMIFVNGEEVPTYKVYVREDGVPREVTQDGKPFFMTPSDTAEVINARNDRIREEKTKEALERKAVTDEAIRQAGSAYSIAPNFFETPIRARNAAEKTKARREADAKEQREASQAARNTVANRPNAARRSGN